MRTRFVLMALYKVTLVDVLLLGVSVMVMQASPQPVSHQTIS